MMILRRFSSKMSRSLIIISKYDNIAGTEPADASISFRYRIKIYITSAGENNSTRTNWFSREPPLPPKRIIQFFNVKNNISFARPPVGPCTEPENGTPPCRTRSRFEGLARDHRKLRVVSRAYRSGRFETPPHL